MASHNNNNNTNKANQKEPPPLAALALAITSQDWTILGLGDDAAAVTTATSDLDRMVERLTALLLVRMVAIAVPSSGTTQYADLSTTTICRAHLLHNDPWPPSITPQVVTQLRTFVSRLLESYSTADTTPYHNQEHAYHVTISMNKLVDLILNTNLQSSSRLPQTFGLRNDALLPLVLLFSCLCHDAEHQGVPNRQLALEDDPLAILYNDQSVAEQRSLFLGFSILLEDQFTALRSAMFLNQDEYRRFRKAVINLVLTTDIASPDRTQLGKSKWKEAFGDPFETVERKVRSEIRRRQSLAHNNNNTAASRRASTESMYSEITTDMVDGEYDDGEISPSITPDSSDNGEDYSLDDDVLSNDGGGPYQDGLIVSSKPFSNVTSTQPGRQNNTNTPTPPKNSDNQTTEASPPQAVQLGYEPDDAAVNEEALGYEATDKNKTPTKSLSDKQKAIVAKANQRFGKKKAALPNPMARRNMSMSDYRAESAASGPSMTAQQKETAKFQRRFSTSGIHHPSTSSNNSGSRKFKYRLGILRAVDLSGEAIETYARSNSMGTAGTGNASATSGRAPSVKSVGSGGVEDEEVDELKVTVIMEQLMAACDVAHNLQSWDHMVKWSNRLFLELKKAHQNGRGPDPCGNWHPNQIGFLESYLLPLARRLEDTGVFGEVIGPVFANIVEANRDQWLTDGVVVTTDIIKEGANRYPVGDENK